MGKTDSLNIWRRVWRLAQRRTVVPQVMIVRLLGVWYGDTYLSLSCVCQASLVHAAVLQGSPMAKHMALRLPGRLCHDVCRRRRKIAMIQSLPINTGAFLSAMPWWSF